MLAIVMFSFCVPSWAASEKVLYRFHGNDGAGPVNVIIGPDGALCDTTVEGGANACLGSGCGVVFRLTQGGTASDTVIAKGCRER